jgi:aspartyl-tRNA synthetase
MQRTNYCGLIDSQYIDQIVVVQGWVNRRRDLGGLIFIDLRDREGLIQIVIEPNSSCFNQAATIKSEYVLEISGIVRKRPQINSELKNGDVEIVANNLAILNISLDLPILVNDATTSEQNRMKYRIIDLRSNLMQTNIKLRHQISKAFRQFLDTHNFIDIETPFLTLSTPGGARDFLVPSRANKGKFYALPQSPQLFKQLFMVAGFDLYYQIVKCFRDEELRADRQPEFTQVDIETSFLGELEIRDIAEKLLQFVFQQVLNIDLGKFPVLTYHDALYYYGCDKPDLRIPLKFIDLTTNFRNSNFKVFGDVVNLKGRIVALKLPQSVQLSRKKFDELALIATKYGAHGLSQIKVLDINNITNGGINSALSKVLTATELNAIIDSTQAQNNETILIIADKQKVVNEALNAIRLKIGKDYNLIDKEFQPLWVIDFPMFEFDELTNQYIPAHHAFTAPKDAHIELLQSKPDVCLAKAYDLVLNGAEIAGGSVRIHQQEIQMKVFKALNLSAVEITQRFGYLLDNLQFGAPPHGGIAFGLDRLVSIICKTESIRDVIALPKTTTGQCLLTNAPSLSLIHI